MKNGEVYALRCERIDNDYSDLRRTSMKPSHHLYGMHLLADCGII